MDLTGRIHCSSLKVPCLGQILVQVMSILSLDLRVVHSNGFPLLHPGFSLASNVMILSLTFEPLSTFSFLHCVKGLLNHQKLEINKIVPFRLSTCSDLN